MERNRNAAARIRARAQAILSRRDAELNHPLVVMARDANMLSELAMDNEINTAKETNGYGHVNSILDVALYHAVQVNNPFAITRLLAGGASPNCLPNYICTMERAVTKPLETFKLLVPHCDQYSIFMALTSRGISTDVLLWILDGCGYQFDATAIISCMRRYSNFRRKDDDELNGRVRERIQNCLRHSYIANHQDDGYGMQLCAVRWCRLMPMFASHWTWAEIGLGHILQYIHYMYMLTVHAAVPSTSDPPLVVHMLGTLMANGCKWDMLYDMPEILELVNRYPTYLGSEFAVYALYYCGCQDGTGAAKLSRLCELYANYTADAHSAGLKRALEANVVHVPYADQVMRLLHDLNRPFSPSRFMIYSQSARRCIQHLVWINNNHSNRNNHAGGDDAHALTSTLPHLPNEVLFEIFDALVHNH